MRTLVQDLRYATRALSSAPGFTAAAILCLTLGIGATTAIFSIVNAVVLRPLPYSQPEQLVRLYSEFPLFPNGGLKKFWISAPEYLELQREAKSWQALEAWVDSGANLAGAGDPIRVTASNVTGGLLAHTGVAPALGRLITAEDDRPGAPIQIVISDGLWKRAFGADSKVIGREVQLNGRIVSVAGVMPRGFEFPPGELDPSEVWAPLQLDPAKPGSPSSHFLSVIGRLRPGVSVGQARQEIESLVRQSGLRESPNTHVFSPKRHYVSMYPLHDEVTGNVRPAMLMLLGAVIFVLLIGCVNVASLLLARAEARQKEIAVRKALGAGVARLARQFLTEGLLLSLGGGAAGVVLAWAALKLVVATNAGSIPRTGEIRIDWLVLAFTLGLSVLTGVAFGLAPLVHALAGNVHEILKSASGRTTASTGSQWFRSGLVVAELALALVLLIGTGLMLKAFRRLEQVDTGLDPRAVLSMRVALPRAVYKEDRGVLNFWGALESRLNSIPGVVSASLASGLPPERDLNANDTQIEGFVPVPGGPIQNIDYWQIVGSHYFETMGIRLIEGRYFDQRDGESAPPVVIVNQTMARIYWTNQSPLGRRVRPGFDGPWRTVVGVAADVRNAGVDKPVGTELYIPIWQNAPNPSRGEYLVVKAKGDPGALTSAVRSQVQALDPSLPVAQVRTLEDVLMAARSRPRFLTVLLSLFSGVSMLLAALGIFGVISYWVALRTGEFGIRMALGAGTGDVLRMVLGQGARFLAAGALLGVAGALLLARFLEGFLFGVSATDPVTFVAMVLGLGAVMMAACLIPARRATRVDPVIALRYE